MPPRLTSLTLRQQQYLLDKKHRFFVNPSGRRSRKTLISKRRILCEALENCGNRYFCGAPTEGQAKSIFWDDLKRDTFYFRNGDANESEMIVTLKNGSMIRVVGLDKPQRIEGTPWNGGIITEFADVKRKAWEENIRPLFSDTNGWCCIEGVPDMHGVGGSYYREVALYAAGGSLPKTRPKLGAFAENPNDEEWCYYHWFSSDVLTSKEIAAAKRVMSDAIFRQEYEGSFEELGNRVFSEFDRAIHVKERPDLEKNETLRRGVGIDFNVNPMTAELFIYGDDWIHFCNEVLLPDSNTFSLADYLRDKNPKLKNAFPDPAGSARKTSATQSDHEILRRKGFIIHAPKAHPPVRDSVNAVNGLLRSADGGVHLTVDPKCRVLIRDFELLQWNDNGSINEKDRTMKHASDAMRYPTFYLFKIGRKIDIGSRDR